MVFVVLQKYFNYGSDQSVNAGHIASTDCNYQLQNDTINDGFFYFLVQAFENRNIQRDMQLCHLTKAFFCHINTLINLYMSATAQLENVQYYGVSLENKKDCFFNQLFCCLKPTFTLNDMLNKSFMIKTMLLQPNLATNARDVFKLCSLFITTLT